MYVAGLVIPVPGDQIDAYRRWAENGAKIFKDYGCLEIVESWEDFVPDGQRTDFRRAVAARPGEKIVFTWQIWPDKESFQAAEARMHEDPRMDNSGEPPFDPSRLILGCFQPVFTMGRT
jgi:uncharacterized protein YbaA (DUF1428 family)